MKTTFLFLFSLGLSTNFWVTTATTAHQPRHNTGRQQGEDAGSPGSTWDALKSTVMSKIYAKIGIFPSTDDPLRLNDTRVDFDNDFVQGNISLRNATIVGLSKLVEDVSINLFALKVTMKASLAKLRFSGKYNAHGNMTVPTRTLEENGIYIREPGPHAKSRPKSESVSVSVSVLRSEFVGEGNIVGLIQGLVMEVEGRLSLNMSSRRVFVSDLDANVSFKSGQLNATNALVNGLPMDFKALNQAIKPNFDRAWATKKKSLISPILIEVNDILGKYSLSDLTRYMTGQKRRRMLSLKEGEQRYNDHHEISLSQLTEDDLAFLQLKIQQS